MSINEETVTVNTIDLSPAAAEEFQRFAELLGDKSSIIWQPEFQSRFRNLLADEAVEDFLYQWEEPTSLHSNEGLATFPVEGLPPVLRDMVTGVAEALQVSPDLVAVIALAALSSAMVGRVKVDVGGTWHETVTLYALGIAESGNRKSAAMTQLTRPLHEIQSKLREAMDADRQKAAIKKSVAEQRVKAAKKKAEKDGSFDALNELEDAMADFDAIEVPALPSLIVNDATPEAMALALEANGERLSVFDAEGGGLSTMAGARYSSNGGSNIDLLLKGHVGDPISTKRVGREDVVLDSPIISMGIMSQAQTLRELINVPNAKGRGLVDRFLIAAPPDKLGYRSMTPASLRPEVVDAYTDLLSSYVMGLWTVEDRYTLRMSADAADALHAYEERCEVRLRPGGDLRAMGGFGSKLVGSAVRLAALHHLAHMGVQRAFIYEIGAASVKWGIQAAEWSLEHYRYAVAMAGEVADVNDADKVLNWLRNRTSKTEVVSLRDVHRMCNFTTKEQTEAAIAMLVEHGWMREAKVRRTGSGRPGSPKWEVHPCLLDE
ncbi:YfjI family protein [Geodermatophilus sp. DSM 45219]|uniref:YfjI family protein n=1 Tax=Geodermatophilus sp. DSM 45219 TaxID=1881103 RepID=UPI00088FC33F|nr:YfjI family protein [Geodermatophilus sp. DSM 45219]SDN79648.1 Protein of unknown function [Geodermatophilus sp. DSM 45219]